MILRAMLLLAALAGSLAAQVPVSAARSDGGTTPLLVYKAAGAGGGCAPLAVISHGAGGSENGYRYLASALSQGGYTAVVMGHRESGLAAGRADVQQQGSRRGGVQELVQDPNAVAARLLDVGAALQWANAQCRAPFRVLLGHSMGAATVMLEAGASNTLGLKSPPSTQDRFDAYVALSTLGPGSVFAKDAWSGIHKPMLIMTGTRDQVQNGGQNDRSFAWHVMPQDGARKCHWLGVVDGATHINFAGNGPGATEVTRLVTPTIAAFLEGVRRDACTLPPANAALVLQAK